MAKHTEGPWHSWEAGGGWISVSPVDKSRKPICRLGVEDMYDSEWYHSPQDKANARLIAAAPELLEACQAIIAEFQPTPIPSEIHALSPYKQVLDAIAKATGGSC